MAGGIPSSGRSGAIPSGDGIEATLDTDGTLAANSDAKIASQKATKTYADTKLSGTLDTDGTLATNSDTRVASQKATKTYADTKLAASYLDTDTALAANSDTKVASQKATKAYADGRTPAASTSASGIVELATAAETETGTDAVRAVTPDGLAGSNFGRRLVYLQVTDPAGAALTTGDGKAYFTVPLELNGMNLVRAHASLTTVSSSGLPTFQLANVTDTVDMLSTKVSIDASEFTSYTAATAPVIDTSKDDVVTGDLLRVDCDVAGTGAKGVSVILTFEVP